MLDNILNVKLTKKFEDRVFNVYPETHTDMVLLGKLGSQISLTDKLNSIDNTLGNTDFSKYTSDMSSGMKTLFESVMNLMTAIQTTRNGNIFIREHTFTPEDWEENSDEGIFTATVESAYINSTDIPDIYFDSESIEIVDNCGVENYYCVDGKLVVESILKPEGNISFKYTLIKEITNASIPESFRFCNCVTTRNEDGSILETYDFGTLLTSKNEDGSIITEVFTDMDGNKTTKTITTGDDGTITEVIS